MEKMPAKSVKTPGPREKMPVKNAATLSQTTAPILRRTRTPAQEIPPDAIFKLQSKERRKKVRKMKKSTGTVKISIKNESKRRRSEVSKLVSSLHGNTEEGNSNGSLPQVISENILPRFCPLTKTPPLLLQYVPMPHERTATRRLSGTIHPDLHPQ